MHYYNLDISIDPHTPDGYPIRADSELFGQARNFLRGDPNSNEIQSWIADIETRNTDKDGMVRFGTHLYRMLFVDGIETVFQQSYGKICGETELGLRVRLRIESPEVAVLPWELIFNPAADCFMGASQRTSLVRYIETNLPVYDLETFFPLSILVVIPNYVDPYPSLDSKSERKNIELALEGLGKNITATILDGKVTLERIIDTLLEAPFNCFHFIGHGEFENEKGMIVLNSEDGGSDFVGEELFSDIFLNHPSMKLVLLNSCKGAETSPTQSFSGMAPRLVKRGVPAVVAMKYPIIDQAAVLFAREFYRMLFKGSNRGRVDVAIAHARNRLAGEFPQEREVCTPVLFLRAKNGVLFDAVTGSKIWDIPLSRKSLDRSHAIQESYRENLKITKSVNDEEGIIRQLELMKLGKYSQIIASVSIIFMFFLSWVNLFDVINLDTQIEKYTLALSAEVKNRPFSPHIRLVTIRDSSFGSAWRERKLPNILEKLSDAGAKVVVFDIKFEKTTKFDPGFAEAIRNAKNAGTQVVVGVSDQDWDGPKLASAIKESGVRFGVACIGRKRERARTIPLAVIGEIPIEGEKTGADRSARIFSLPLEAYAAFKDLNIRFVDLDERYILLDTDAPSTPRKTIDKVGFAELTRVKSKQGCSIFNVGDTIADAIIEPYPVDILRAKNRAFSYQEVLNYSHNAAETRFKGKIVLVGVLDKDEFEEKRGFRTEKWFGVELQAEALNTLLNGISIQPMGETEQILFMICLGLCGAFIRSRKNRVRSWIAISAVLLVHGGYLFCSILICSLHGLLLNSVYHIGAFWLSYGATAQLEKRI